MEKPDFKKVLFMHIQALTNFPYIEEDFDALTDYALLCDVVKHLNKVIENDNLQNEAITELYNSFVSLKEYVEEYLVDMDDLKEKVELINQAILVIENKLADQEIEIQNVRVDMTSLINENFNILKSYVDYNDAILDDKITNIQIGAISVYNPTNGLLQPLQTVINDLYGASNKDGLTAEEFDDLELSATAFDAYQITAYEFDSQGKTILV